jgi:hypothetical protein
LVAFRGARLTLDFRPAGFAVVARLTFAFALRDFPAGFLAVDFRPARLVAVVRPTLPFLAALFLGGRLLLTTFRAFFATSLTATPTAFPAVTANS